MHNEKLKFIFLAKKKMLFDFWVCSVMILYYESEIT